jgi:F-type H+-transporting ATPase subunit delta
VRVSSTARRIAGAAFAVAQEEGDTAGWLADLRTAANVVERPEMASYFKDPKVPQEQKLQSVNDAFGSVRPTVQNLLRMLVSQQRIYLLPGVYREFELLDRAARGVTEATVRVARPISDADQRQIADRLAQMTGKMVELHTEIDPSILGGVVVRLGDRLIDASVAGRLQRLRHRLAV